MEMLQIEFFKPKSQTRLLTLIEARAQKERALSYLVQ